VNIQEAINLLKENKINIRIGMGILEDVDLGISLSDAIEIAIETLEKQIPYKPTERKGFEGKCKCGVVFLDRLTNYCGNCGQKLDWEVLE
jgi:hypothetical protein